MKYLLFVIITFFSAQAQEFNKLDDKGLKNGIWKGVYPDSNRPRFEGTFEHGKEIGLFKFFDDTKAVTIIATREFNAKDNSCYTIFYNQKGLKVSEGKLIGKLYEGEWKYYHFDSPDIMTTELYSNGKLNGVRKVYYKSKLIAEETAYKNGNKEGVYKKYAENGIVLEEINYKNNVFEGLSTFKNSENVIVSKGIYKKGKKEGTWEFNNNGKITKENMSKPNQRKFVKKPITRE
ncbi:toxin-antitoxin system YwqK family antitoxin [Flavobacterium sp.]|uniref:toxin-antitoxin system YwqK family antitoxin n=1 Tax=Flavobacterium sp. TaxID=239 RepID=UPI0037536C64